MSSRHLNSRSSLHIVYCHGHNIYCKLLGYLLSTKCDLCLFSFTGDGSVVTWGWNEHGMCGTGDTTNVTTPHIVMAASERGGNTSTTLIGAGAGHSIALVQEQTLTKPTS